MPERRDFFRREQERPRSSGPPQQALLPNRPEDERAKARGAKLPEAAGFLAQFPAGLVLRVVWP
ncbi:MAG: hypothetical protein HY000_01610 [Planctomycetes bacterium]|nr:hypothetical protein [Planctomycetota bacterium]